MCRFGRKDRNVNCVCARSCRKSDSPQAKQVRPMGRLRRLRQLVVGSLVLALLGATLIIQQWSATSGHILGHPYFNYSLESEDPGQACQLPRIHPFDQSIWKYFPPPRSIVCKSRQPDTLVHLDKTGSVRLDPNVASEYPGLSCTYRPVVRPDGVDDKIEYGPEVVISSEGLQVDHDFILVRCVQKSLLSLERVVYEGFLVHARKLDEGSGLPSRSEGASKLEKLSRLGPLKGEPSKLKKYNVLLFGVDSLSRLAFIRLLPKTYSYLTNTLKAHVFRGMNKIADNTFPNLIALLAGDDPYGGRLPLPPAVPHFDGWPLVWKNFSDMGYRTLFAEDLPDYNMFNFLSPGFKDPPAPYYLRPFWLAVKDSSVLKSSSHLCLGNRPRHQLQMDYVEGFVTAQKNPYFAFSFLAEVSHDYLSRAASADDDFEGLLGRLKDGGYLDDTVLIFFSDHGHRFDSIRGTPVGRIEERMPFFSLVLPAPLRNQIPIANTGRLITPYDVHATLLDLAANQHQPSRLGKVTTRFGTSLFGPVPANRTCAVCGIPAHYCVCSAYREEDRNEVMDPALQGTAGQAVIDSVNSLLTSKCARLALDKVNSAVKSNEGGWILVVRAEPGGALFEALVKVTELKHFVVEGEVSRINKYKGQSECVDNAVLRKYCYCR